jgi:hypothetical protein
MWRDWWAICKGWWAALVSLFSLGGEFEILGLTGDIADDEIRAHKTFRTDVDSEYTDAGRLACIFLDDFLSR